MKLVGKVPDTVGNPRSAGGCPVSMPVANHVTNAGCRYIYSCEHEYYRSTTDLQLRGAAPNDSAGLAVCALGCR